MKSLIILFFILQSCNNVSKEIDFCEISNSIFIEKLKDSPNINSPIIVNKINKIDEPTIKTFLLTNSKKFDKYDFNSYFNSINSNIIHNFKCETIDFNTFNTEVKNGLTLINHKSNFNEVKYIQFYEAIFNNDKSEFILFYKEIRSDFRSSYRLEQYYFKDGIITLKNTILIST